MTAPSAGGAVETIRASVAIVGSGMGGATLAWGLAQRGIDSVVLERGHRIAREPENWDPLAVFRDRRYKPAEMWRDASGGEFSPGVHYVVGGNTKVYGASLPRFRVRDFEERRYPAGVSPAWPFTYADLEPYYCRAEQLYRVHGRSTPHPFEPWRSAPYAYPELPHEPYVAAVVARLEAQGLHPTPTAMGLDLRSGGPCVRCATCDGFPCRVEAKSDAEMCALQPAIAANRVRLLEGVRVERIETSGNRVTALTATRAGEPVRIEAGAFVLAAGAANSAALLLRSRTHDHPEGLANSSGQVGRNYMVHNNTHIVAVSASGINDVVFQKTAAVNDFYEDLGDGYPGGTLQLIGKVQASMMKTHATRVPMAVLGPMARRSIEWLVMSEDLPDPQNRVTVDANGGIVVAWRRTNYDRHEMLLARAKLALRRAGYPMIFEQRFGIAMNSHMCGTARAGADPRSSVVDPLCRSHDLGNLWIVDSSFFPSSAAQNPALTIAAQALRVAAETDWAGAV